MRRTFLLLILSFCTFLLFACQSQDEELTLLDNISSVFISESDGYGGLNENYFMTIDDDARIRKFEGILKKADGKKQKVDIINGAPDYDMLVHYENGETHGLHLDLGTPGEKSRIMYIGHENNGFDVSPEDTETLREIVDDQ